MSFENLVAEVGELLTPGSGRATAVVATIRKQVKEYVETNKLKSLVLGVSGGLDSAVVAALCQEKYTGVPLIGISIPMSSTNEHKEQARWVGENFCSVFEEFDGWDNNELFSILEKTDKLATSAGFAAKSFPKSLLQGNMKARLRMVTLYDLAKKTNGLVLSTDNLSEYQMGFWTICGDVGDFGPIQNVGKGFELPVIARALGVREDIIVQPPSDGLMVTTDNTDEAQLGASYQEVDTVMSIYLGTLDNISEYSKKTLKPSTANAYRARLYRLMAEDPEAAKKISNVISRYENSLFKRKGTVNLTREQIGIQS
jgi:nicotinamide-nucleotide amidase